MSHRVVAEITEIVVLLSAYLIKSLKFVNSTQIFRSWRVKSNLFRYRSYLTLFRVPIIYYWFLCICILANIDWTLTTLRFCAISSKPQSPSMCCPCCLYSPLQVVPLHIASMNSVDVQTSNMISTTVMKTKRPRRKLSIIQPRQNDQLHFKRTNASWWWGHGYLSILMPLQAQIRRRMLSGFWCKMLTTNK